MPKTSHGTASSNTATRSNATTATVFWVMAAFYGSWALLPMAGSC